MPARGRPRREDEPPLPDLTVALCLGSYGGSRGGAVSHERGIPVARGRTVYSTDDLIEGLTKLTCMFTRCQVLARRDRQQKDFLQKTVDAIQVQIPVPICISAFERRGNRLNGLKDLYPKLQPCGLAAADAALRPTPKSQPPTPNPQPPTPTLQTASTRFYGVPPRASPGGGEVAPHTLNPQPYTLHPTPYTLHPTPYTLRPTASILTLHPQPRIPNSKP